MRKFFISIMLSCCFFLGGVFATDNVVGMQHITHTRTDATVNLSRDVMSGNNQADMFLRNDTTKVFDFLSTIDVFKKSTSLHITGNGNYVVRFIPTGGGNDIRYSFFVTGMQEQQTTITHVPKTGATSNILLVLGIAVFLYVLYWYRKIARSS